jgi:hypothetical protein
MGCIHTRWVAYARVGSWMAARIMTGCRVINGLPTWWIGFLRRRWGSCVGYGLHASSMGCPCRGRALRIMAGLPHGHGHPRLRMVAPPVL